MPLTPHKRILFFYQDDAELFPSPTGLSPDNELVSDTTPTLTWDEVPGATDYTVRVYDDDDNLVYENLTATIPDTSDALNPLDGPFTWTVNANPGGLVATGSFDYTANSKVTAYMQSLGAVLLFDGTLNGSNIANLGSAGSALDGVSANVTIDSNGMNFNGDSSSITVPLTAALSALTDQEAVIIGNALSGGEGGTGTFFRYGFNPLRMSFTTGGTNILAGVDYDTTDATTQITAPGTGSRQYFLTHNATTKLTRIHLGASGTLTTPGQTPVAGVTNIVAPTSDLVIGNITGGTNGWHGYMSHFVWFPRQLITDERQTIVDFLA